jgi:hypothetical protein
MDFVYIGGLLLAIALTVAFAHACAKLGGQQ